MVLINEYKPRQLTLKCPNPSQFSELFSFIDVNLDFDTCDQLQLQKQNFVKLSPQDLDVLTRKLACILIGGQGDALGFRVEFLSFTNIIKKFGSLFTQISKTVSDDTQMTLFAELAMQQGGQKQNFQQQFLNWHSTQLHLKQAEKGSQLHQISSALNHLRAPGGTCMSALAAGGHGSFTKKINDSKGCGTIMRNGTIALHGFELDYLVNCAAVQALITHTHDDAMLPCCFQTVFQTMLFVCQENNWFQRCQQALRQTDEYLTKSFLQDKYQKSNTKKLMGKLMLEKLHNIDLNHQNYQKSTLYLQLKKLGQGWVADEALAIAIFCLMQSEDPMQQIIIAANHDGDSDSTACVCGQIYGSVRGFRGFPIEGVDLDVLDEVAWVCK
uniref:ADP-ribosylhydrolase ARH3 n=1 Tax=Trepomonas sp. PC1 TaxID=1076344 RepID=A0A146KBN4_9EUKA|eukprot:JAP92789.1 ADP-ribosylglycohydrolase [Trepomonas sp. PC1]